MTQHKISLFSAILLNMNIMIGSGILIGSSVSAGIAGNASFLAWFVVFLCLLPLVLSVITLSQVYPGTGGVYLYATRGFGERAGYISAWLYMTGYTFLMVVELLALRQTLANSHDSWLFHAPFFFNLTVVTLSGVLTLSSTKAITRFLSSLTIIKLLPLLIAIVLIPFILNPAFTISRHELCMLPWSLSLPIFSFFGFESCTNISHLIKDSAKNAPRAIFLGFFIAASLYTLFHFSLLNIMGAANLSTLGSAQFAEFITLPIPSLKEVLLFLIPAAVSMSFYAVSFGVLNANVSTLHVLAHEKQILGSSYLARVTHNGRPYVATLLQCGITFLLLTYVPNLEVAGGLCILGVMSSLFLSVLTLVIGRQQHDLKTKIIGVLGVIVALGLASYSWYNLAPDIQTRMQYTAPLIASLAVGLLLRSRKK